MSFRFARLAVGLALSGLACAAISAQAQSQNRLKGRPIEFSDGKVSEISTNVSPLGSKKNGLQQLEEELNRSLRSSSKNSVDNMLTPGTYMRPPAVFVAPNARLQETLERRKNWAFATPEELMLGPNPNGDSLSPVFPGDKPKISSSFERFYDNLAHQHRDNSTQKSASGEDMSDPRNLRPPHDDIDPNEERGLPDSVKQNAQQLKKLLSSEPNNSIFGSLAVHSSFSDFFGLGADKDTATREGIAAHKAYMDQYRQVLGGSPAASSLTPLNPQDTARQPGSVGGLDTLATPRHDLPVSAHDPISSPGGMNALLNPTALPDRNAAILNAWNPLYVPPKPEAPKPTTLAVPTSQAPRRQF